MNMKVAITSTLLLLLAVSLNHAVSADPIQVSGNNVGDLITVGMNVNANIDSTINTNIVNVIVAILIELGDLNPEYLQTMPQLPPLNPEEQKLVHVVVDKLKHH